MSEPHTPARVPPSPADLLARYLERQTEAHAAGLAADRGGEVVPYEAGPVQPVDARTAWDEATAALRLLGPGTRASQPPPDWPGLATGQEPATALALALGNFPQMVRDLHLLLRAEPLRALRPAGRPASAPGLLDWAGKVAERRQFPQALLAVGVLRSARVFDRAGEILSAHDAAVPAEWRSAWENEKAALAWHRGEEEAARSLWLAQPESVPVLFNRGMAALFLDRAAEARPALQEAASRLPETGAWHHLARLYLSLAELRG